ncbi:MAG: hypothetical protein KDB01_16550 [Planctomycetaceae bacterium]|nr:hypothetical protein [Planctomycetaceae bacterium]
MFSLQAERLRTDADAMNWSFRGSAAAAVSHALAEFRGDRTEHIRLTWLEAV